MVGEWKRNGFDYQSKAHPSVLRILYKFVLPPLDEQRRIATILQAADDAVAAAQAVIDQTEKVKRGLVEHIRDAGEAHAVSDDGDWEGAGVVGCRAIR
jgi:hypothetical protein